MAEHDTLGEIQDALESHSSFVVEAGAGSGKTRSLIQTIESVLEEHRSEFERSNRRVVCITYTNVAKDEIRSRLNDDPMVLVDTIHEFLWAVCSGFQRELKLEVIALNEQSKSPIEDLPARLDDVNITYGRYGRHFDRGELFHDDVIKVARALFEKYPKICRIAADRFPYIFVDEYQDTAAEVVELLLEFFAANLRSPVVGFFGDAMQQIYDSKIADVAPQYGLRLITKVENYRCSVKVIDVLNRLRSDLQQEPAGENLPGDTHLFTVAGDAEGAYERAIIRLEEHGWSRENTKILMLTHRGIAREIGYSHLLAAYGKRSFGNDVLMERSDEFGEFFTFIDALLAAESAGRYGRFLEILGSTGFSLRSTSEKRRISAEVASLRQLTLNGTVDDVAQFVKASEYIPLPKRLSKLMARLDASQNGQGEDEAFAKRKPFHDAVLAVPWSEVLTFIQYADEHTPFSTKHGVKGAEFENVLVLIDDTLWNQYKFYGVFTGSDSISARLERSKKLLYVCFSRAISGLAVVCLNPLAAGELAGALELLGLPEAQQI
jgi:DNA helicase-2/ATP-dependent DNA helicase PcrA